MHLFTKEIPITVHKLNGSEISGVITIQFLISVLFDENGISMILVEPTEQRATAKLCEYDALKDSEFDEYYEIMTKECDLDVKMRSNDLRDGLTPTKCIYYEHEKYPTLELILE